MLVSINSHKLTFSMEDDREAVEVYDCNDPKKNKRLRRFQMVCFIEN